MDGITPARRRRQRRIPGARSHAGGRCLWRFDVITGIALVAHHERALARELAIEAAQWCVREGVEVWMPPVDADTIGVSHLANDRPIAESDLVLSLGGDGT